MKFAAIPCLLIAGMVASSSIARQPDDNIEVLGSSTVHAWTQNVSRDIDENIGQEIRKYRMHGQTPTGVASVRFLCSETGEPTSVELMRRSPNRQLNDVARSAVSGIKTLHPLPQGVGNDQVFVANIVVATNEADYARYMNTLRDDQQGKPTMAQSGTGSGLQPIAVNVAVRAPG